LITSLTDLWFSGVPERQYAETERALPAKFWLIWIPPDLNWPCRLDLPRTRQVDRSQTAAHDWFV